MKKKILSVLLTVAMLVSMATLFVGTASATEGEADLSDGIDNYADLEAFIESLATKDYAGETVVLNADITVNEGWLANDGTADAVAAPTGENAKLLDTSVATTAFAGTFDGNNKTIKGLYMTSKALFPTANGATVKNVTFDNCAAVPTAYDSSKNTAAIVIGRLTGGSLTLNNVTVKNAKIVNGTVACYMGTFIGRTESGAGKISIENCHTVACNIYSGANTTLIGGIAGCINGASSVNIKNCSSDTDIEASGKANNGYKLGGIIGSSATLISIEGCVNSGDIQSQSFAAGMVGDVGTAAVMLKNCLNSGDITAATISSNDAGAGGMFGRINNGADKNNGCIIEGCLNTGKITASTSGTGAAINAGGLVGYAQLKRDRKTVAIIESANFGEVDSGVNAGGAIGNLNSATVSSGDINDDEIYVSDFVNAANVTAQKKAGGLAGSFNGTSGKIIRFITVGVITGYNGGTAINTGSSCAIFGTWAQECGTDELEVVDFFYSNNGVQNVFGLWANLGTTKDNYKASYTATNQSFDLEPGVTNAGESSPGTNLSIYNKFFVENGYKADPTDFYAEKGAAIFSAFGLGVDWMLTSTVPVPASVFALMEDKTVVKGDVDYIGYQKNAEDTLSSIRVIVGLNKLDYENTGFELYLVQDGKEVTMADKNTTTVYTSLNVYDKDGNLGTPYTADGYSYLSAITVSFSADALSDANTLIVKPYVTVSGVKMYGTSCAIVIVKDGGELEISDQYVM